MIERVHIMEDWPTMGQRVIVRGRPHPNARAAYLKCDGTWEEITEGAVTTDVGFVLPEGVLDAIVDAWLRVAAPLPATERHLTDAIVVRDRLLTMLEEREVMP